MQRLLIVTLACLFTQLAAAQGPATVVNAFWDAMTCGRTREAATLFHPDDRAALAQAAARAEHGAGGGRERPSGDNATLPYTGTEILSALLLFAVPGDERSCGRARPQLAFTAGDDPDVIRVKVTTPEGSEDLQLSRLHDRYYLRLGARIRGVPDAPARPCPPRN